VYEGMTVGQGETIGYLGATGMATGTHCHLEVFVDGQNVDPSAYFFG
jgi:murein DD-endopeptidase MepM/ murein hydrolase activator NlpD